MSERNYMQFFAGVALGVLVTVIYCDRVPGKNYEFHPGNGGSILWRGNVKTGDVRAFSSAKELHRFDEIEKQVGGFRAPEDELVK